MSPRAPLSVFADAPELAENAARHILACAERAIAARGAFHLALAGGSTPRATYLALAGRLTAADSARWRLWFGDERCVPPEHADSNFRMAREAWLHALPPGQVERLRGEAEPAAEAERYQARLLTLLGEPARLDLVLLGLGPDGHTASLFPGSPVLAASTWVALEEEAPKPPPRRLTLTLRTLNAARGVLFLVAGADKARCLAEILVPTTGAAHLPAAQVRPAEPPLWFADRAAAVVAVEGFEPPTRGL